MCSNQEPPAFDFGELEEAIVLQGVKMSNDEAAKACMLFFSLSFSSFLTFAKCNQLLILKKQREQ